MGKFLCVVAEAGLQNELYDALGQEQGPYSNELGLLSPVDPNQVIARDQKYKSEQRDTY